MTDIRKKTLFFRDLDKEKDGIYANIMQEWDSGIEMEFFDLCREYRKISFYLGIHNHEEIIIDDHINELSEKTYKFVKQASITDFDLCFQFICKMMNHAGITDDKIKIGYFDNSKYVDTQYGWICKFKYLPGDFIKRVIDSFLCVVKKGDK